MDTFDDENDNMFFGLHGNESYDRCMRALSPAEIDYHTRIGSALEDAENRALDDVEGDNYERSSPHGCIDHTGALCMDGDEPEIPINDDDEEDDNYETSNYDDNCGMDERVSANPPRAYREHTMFDGPISETDEQIRGKPRGFTEIYIAAISCGTAEEVHQLLAIPGFDVNRCDDRSPALLQSLARGHMAEGVFVVLASDADPNVEDPDTGNRVLHDTVSNMTHGLHVDANCAIEGLAVVHLLLSYGASIHHLNGHNRTPLHLAVLAGQPNVVKLLLDQGAYADLHIQDVDDATPGDYAKNLVLNLHNSSVELDNFDDLMTQYSEVESIIRAAEAYEEKCHTFYAGDSGAIEAMLKPSQLLQTPRQVFSTLSRAGLLVPYDDRWHYANQVDNGGSQLMKTIVDEERRVAG